MKELSIKEKAERYDELLAKLRKAKKDNDVCDERYCCVIDDIVPELEESEDEKIRKYLIILLQHFCKGYRVPGLEFPVSFKDMLSWLEKQGEQNLPLKEIILNVWELGNYWKDLTKGVCNTEHGTQLDYILKHWTEGEHYTKLLEKQGEKKSADKVELDAHKTAAWIEEDEKILQWIITDIERLINDNKKADIIANQEIKWLKSLRPQNTWKPSDEQMIAIKQAVKDMKESPCYDSELVSLFNDLKKLRTE